MLRNQMGTYPQFFSILGKIQMQEMIDIPFLPFLYLEKKKDNRFIKKSIFG
jgi:hypothetical protein